MREKVTIVLNEREPRKAEAARLLAQRLTESGITVSRLAIDSRLIDKLESRRSRVVVLDYLMANLTTGLDLLAQLRQGSHPPRVFFLTDEPSVKVAVDAVRLGAANYHELDNPGSIDALCREIREAIGSLASSQPRTPRRFRELAELTAEAASSRTVIRQARGALAAGTSLWTIHGGPGSGKSSLAQALLGEAGLGGGAVELDLRTYPGKLSDIVEQLSRAEALLIENAEEDDGAVARAAWEAASRAARRPMIIACTGCARTARAWRALRAERIDLPVLSERAQDIQPLVRGFTSEAQEIIGRRIKPFEAETISWLARQDYPFGLRQLRGSVIECAAEPSDRAAALAECMRRWRIEAESALPGSDPDPLEAARALELAGGDARAAAAQLGCGIWSLRRAAGVAV